MRQVKGLQRKRNMRRPQRTVNRRSVPAANKFTRYVSSPSIRKTGNKIRVVHSEFVGDVDQLNQVLHFTANPTNHELFPWLVHMTTMWEKYRVLSCTFRYKSTTGTTVPGSVIMSFDYDPMDKGTVTKRNLLQFETAVSGSIWNDHTLKLKKNMISQELYLDDNQSTNLRFTDFGRLYYKVEADTDLVKNPGQAGQLWVDYDIELISPQVARDPSAGLNAAGFGDSIQASAISDWKPDAFTAQDLSLAKRQIGGQDVLAVLFERGARKGLYEVLMQGSTSDPAFEAPVMTMSSNTLQTTEPEYFNKETTTGQFSMATKFYLYAKNFLDAYSHGLYLQPGKGTMAFTNLAVRYVGSRVLPDSVFSNTMYPSFKTTGNSLQDSGANSDYDEYERVGSSRSEGLESDLTRLATLIREVTEASQ